MRRPGLGPSTCRLALRPAMSLDTETPGAQMAKPARTPQLDEKKLLGVLQKYACPVPYHEVRTRFLGNIATPARSASPIRVVKGLWGGELPEFESMDAVNELIGLLINGLWNDLTRHQKRTEPFRLIRRPVEQTRAGLAAYALMRRQELDGFIEGVMNGEEELELPEKATAALDILAELRAMVAGVHRLAADEGRAGSEQEMATSLKQLQELTPIIEREMHAAVLACTRARRQVLQSPRAGGPAAAPQAPRPRSLVGPGRGAGSQSRQTGPC